MQHGISAKLIHQFLYLISGCLFFGCLEKFFEEERNKNKKETVEVLQQEAALERAQENKDWDSEILVFDLIFVG